MMIAGEGLAGTQEMGALGANWIGGIELSRASRTALMYRRNGGNPGFYPKVFA